jgi:hypothetical protein
VILSNPPGRPTDLTDELIEQIISFVPGNYSVNQVARMSGIPQQRISEWLTRGSHDLLNGINSITAQFTVKFRQAEGKEVKSLLAEMHDIGSFNSTSWLLEKCYPEDYGNDAPFAKEIRETFRALKEMKEEK